MDYTNKYTLYIMHDNIVITITLASLLTYILIFFSDLKRLMWFIFLSDYLVIDYNTLSVSNRLYRIHSTHSCGYLQTLCSYHL